MKRWLLYVSGVLLLIILAVGVYYRSWLPYGWRQLKGQLAILWGVSALPDVLRQDTLTIDARYKLHLIGHIRRFAEDSLGLKPTKNYRNFYDTQGKPILWVVTAAPPFALAYYEWNFPFLGKASYKGHFERCWAEKDSAELTQMGFEVSISQVEAWSTLGILPDPILSSMLALDEGNLAELIIHELSHSTLYIRGNVEFNENLASFIGQEGAKRFLQAYYGRHSWQYQSYCVQTKDESIYTGFVLKKATLLDSIYNSPSFLRLDKEEKKLQREQFFANMQQEALALPIRQAHWRQYWQHNPPSFNNVRLTNVLRYYRWQDSLAYLFQTYAQSDLKQLMTYLKSRN